MEWSERIGRRIRLRDLHILLAVVQCKSMAKAAEHLAISKPVVSKVIADLEQVLGRVQAGVRRAPVQGRRSPLIRRAWKAAEHLAISKPVVSKVIADLEQVLGVRLLERDRHGAEPTIYGAALLKRGTTVFDELREGVKDIEFLTDPAAGELRIGGNPLLVASFVSAVID